MPNAILSIQSSVAYGHVGNSAAVFPLQRLGFEVWPVPTAVFSNHTGYPTARGRVLEPAEVDALLQGIEERGAFARTCALLTGYLGSAATGEVVMRALARLRAAQPAAHFLCDPVMGDDGNGFFVRPGIPELYRDRLLPMADLVTPNRFELAWLAGIDVATLDAARTAMARLRERGPRIVVATGLRLPERPHELLTLADTADATWAVRTPRLDRPLHGTGDAFAALLLAWWLRTASISDALARATSAMQALVETTAATASPELALVASQASYETPPRLLDVERMA
jgi:pyridoxine kinase